jgi:hypothetical protein
MFPLSTWIYLSLLPLWLLFTYKFNKRLSWTIPFILVVILFLAFPLAQYPNIFHLDTFYHSAAAKRIATQGNLQIDMPYMVYPGAPILSAILSEISGIPILETAIVLSSSWILLIFVLLFCIGRLLTKTSLALDEMSWLAPAIYLAFNFMFYNNYHFSPQLLGLSLYVLLVYVFIKELRLRAQELKVVTLLLLSALTITHVFSGLFSVLTLLCIYIGGTKIRAFKLSPRHLVDSTLVMYGVLIFLYWHNFVAINPFMSSFSVVIEALMSPIGLVKAVTPGFSPGSFTPFLNFYHYGIYALFALMSIFGLVFSWYKAEVRLILLLGVAILLGGIAIYLTPATFGVRRILLYGGVIISSLSLCAMAGRYRSSRFLITNSISKVFRVVLPFLIIGTFLVANIQNCTYTQFVHPDEVAAIEFIVLENTGHHISATLEYASVIPFFSREPLPMLYIDPDSSPDRAKTIFENVELSLQYLPRQLYDYNLSFVEGRNHLIYSNGLARIYAQRAH